MVECLGPLAQSVPRYKLAEMENVYPMDSAKQLDRIYSLKSKFIEKFGIEPDFYCRSPGRVNLIGEHVDYSDYSVLPMAISKDSLMAVKTNYDGIGKIELANVMSKYPSGEFYHEPIVHVKINSSIHEWTNYFKCGYKGIMDIINPDKPVSMKILIDGNVPAGGGLSSSSAFVCAAALATMHAHGNDLTKGQLTAAAIRGESFAGVRIGGMDQSISVMGIANSALKIDFYPKLDATLVKMEPKAAFVIANTMVTSDKHVTAPIHYNYRVIECRFASALLAKKLNLVSINGMTTLKKVQEAHLGIYTSIAVLQQMIDETEKHFKREPYTLEEIAQELKLTVEQLKNTYVCDIVVKAEKFYLYKRAKHVFTEAQRVYQYQELCNREPRSNYLDAIGKLMNESHFSCRDLFECSSLELDELTEICRY